jgi:hypothetical protein
MSGCPEIVIEKTCKGIRGDYEAYGSIHKRDNRRVPDLSLRTFCLPRYSPSLASIARIRARLLEQDGIFVKSADDFPAP